MNIMFVNAADSWGGGEGWTLRTATELAKRGHNVTLVVRVHSPLASRAQDSGIHLRPVVFSYDYHPATIRQLVRLYHELKTEVVVVHFPKDVRTAGVAAKIAGIPVVHRNGFPVLKNTLRHRITARFVDRILTNSERIRDTYAGYGWLRDKPIDVVANGVDVPDTQSKRDPSRFGFEKENLVAAYVGRLSSVKRVDDLFDAFSRLPKESAWRLSVVGTGSEEELLKNRAARESEISRRVCLLGFVDNAAELAGCADLVVLPSSDEGMPNALMEAMVRGVPVAASPVGDVPQLLDNGNAGFLVPLRSPDAWTTLLNELEEDSSRRTSVGKLGRARVLEHYTLSAMIDGVESCLAAAVHTP